MQRWAYTTRDAKKDNKQLDMQGRAYTTRDARKDIHN